MTLEERRIERRLEFAGPILGGAAGILTGVAWSRLLVRRAFRHPGPLALRGALLGLTAGVLSTAVLHLGLSVIQEGLPALIARFPWSLAFGLVFGIPAGAVVGSCGGSALDIARRRAEARSAVDGPAPDQRPTAGADPRTRTP